jgi:hypothetical protein
MTKNGDTLVRPLPDRFTLEATMKRRHRIQLLIAVLVSLVIAVALFARGGDTPSTGARPSASTSPTLPQTSVSAAPSPSASVAPGSSDDVRVQEFHGAQLPTSRTSGPAKVEGEVVSGFSQTPLGAALAAIHLSFRTTPDLGPGVFRPAILKQVAGDANAFLAQVTAQYEQQRKARGLPEGAELERSGARVNAYRVDNYSVSEPVIVHVVVSDPSSGTLVDVPVSVLWSGTDWKLLAPPSGTYSGATIPSDSGYNHLPES